jgi:hypothetical protein
VERLLECHKSISEKIGTLSEKTIEYEYRLSSLEQRLNENMGKHQQQ